jgi:hypothetical protein
MWFSHNDLIHKKSIIVDDLHGYILPHAGTKYTGYILSHTLQFKPKKVFNKIIIIYYPAHTKPNIYNKYYHEYYVVWKTLEYVIKHFWNIKTNITYVGYNIRDNNIINSTNNINYTSHDSLIVISADFSHFLPLQKALHLENCAAHSIMHRILHTKCTNIVDHIDSFKLLYKLIPNNYMLQWIGRTRSSGETGVGYLSFLIRENPNPAINLPDGMFVTVYDKNMQQRECLGEWFRNSKWNTNKEQNLINKVIKLGKTTSRLTNGKFLNIPLVSYTVTYLYENSTKHFIRGWHGIKYNSFYLPDVMLENTFNNGKWITSNDILWPKENKFYIKETLNKLVNKFQGHNSIHKINKIESINYILYSTHESHKNI